MWALIPMFLTFLMSFFYVFFPRS